MSRFAYPLEAALEARTSVQTRACQALATAQRELAGQRQTLAVIETDVAAGRRALLTGGVNVARELAEIERRLDRLRHARDTAVQRVACAQRTAAGAHAEYVHAVRERSALERHRSRRYEEFLARQARRDASEHDEQNAPGMTLPETQARAPLNGDRTLAGRSASPGHEVCHGRVAGLGR